jgi:hypothetical protein
VSSRAILVAACLGVALHALAAAGAVATHACRGLHTVVTLGLFFGGTAAMGAAIVAAAVRSRTDAIGMGGLFFAAGSAPRRVALALQAALALDVVVALAAAGARPLTSVAFGVLAPLWPLGVMGLWCARHGTFPRREPARAVGR